jgi:LuxR family maltose regulon positive regulatory protein
MNRALALVDSPDESGRHQSSGIAPSVLETKFYVPRARFDAVPRPRLTDAIRRGAERKLTIVIAPAGFGKTTLVAAGLAGNADGRFAWLSLDASENEPTLFWIYVISALQKIHPNIGDEAIARLQSSEPPPIESVLTTVINEIDATDRDLTLVLDDYHVIDSDAIHAAMTFLLDRLPRRMRIVIASRSQPPLSLARLRARDELTELRSDDLRFTLDETSTFLRNMSLDLSAADMEKLEQHTEGWIAGLKLAALSMKGRDDVRGFVDMFSGDSRHITDYLVEEVLQAEPGPVRHFLLRTSILERLSAPLCEAVTGEGNGQAILDDLERRSLFVVPLDDRREWYRYHHLFADVLRKQLSAGDADGAHLLHRRASVWYEAHGSRADAIRHALAGEDLERAADILETEWPNKDRSRESRQWLEQIRRLPQAMVRARPLLSMGYAWGLLNSGELEAAEPWLRVVESSLEAGDARFPSLPAEVAAARVYLTQSLGGAPGTLEHAQRALALAPAGDEVARATGTALVALAQWGRGDLEAAHDTFSEALAIMRASGKDIDAVRGMFVLGDIRVAQGRLRDAAKIYEHGLQFARDETFSMPPETDELNLGLSEVHLEWNEVGTAIGFLDVVEASRARNVHGGNRLRWCIAMANVRAAEGNLDGAVALLDEAGGYERRDPVPRARPIAAIKARIRIAQGRLDEVAAWAEQAKVSIDGDLTYLREFEHITLTRMLIARHSGGGDQRPLRDAERLLERLHTSARSGGRVGAVIEISVLASIVQHALGNLRGALDRLGDALALAEPEGFLRTFLDGGTRVRDLLRHSIARGLSHAYSKTVLAAFDGPRQPVAPAAPPSATNSSVVSDLTTRELEILRLIGAGLRNQEIADHLSISAATVKRHIANAYAKLGASHRTEALVRAAELKLL